MPSLYKELKICPIKSSKAAEEETPARDQYGNIIGEEITINGKKYYVVKTDENGEEIDENSGNVYLDAGSLTIGECGSYAINAHGKVIINGGEFYAAEGGSALQYFLHSNGVTGVECDKGIIELPLTKSTIPSSAGSWLGR